MWKYYVHAGGINAWDIENAMNCVSVTNDVNVQKLLKNVKQFIFSIVVAKGPNLISYWYIILKIWFINILVNKLYDTTEKSNRCW
jgi:hypothetical protein